MAFVLERLNLNDGKTARDGARIGAGRATDLPEGTKTQKQLITLDDETYQFFVQLGEENASREVRRAAKLLADRSAEKYFLEGK